MVMLFCELTGPFGMGITPLAKLVEVGSIFFIYFINAELTP